MKRLIYICFVVILSCDSESAFDCFQTAGSGITQEFEVLDFNQITVNRDVELILKEGEGFEVVVETGENLLNDIDVTVIDGRLEITDNNTCNFVRDFGITKAYVTAPNITEIRNSSQFTISSEGVLNYPNLSLISEDFNNSDVFAVGDFDLTVNSETITVVSNNTSFFNISGSINTLNINFASGLGRFEGENLIAQNVNVFHRGSNDMIVNPQQSLTGTITSTGNVISLNRPPLVEVEQRFTGRLIFQD